MCSAEFREKPLGEMGGCVLSLGGVRSVQADHLGGFTNDEREMDSAWMSKLGTVQSSTSTDPSSQKLPSLTILAVAL